MTHFHVSWRQLALMVLKEQGIHEGLWQLGVDLAMAGTNVGPTPESATPGILVSLGGVTMTRVEAMMPLTLDAAAVNPRTASN